MAPKRKQEPTENEQQIQIPGAGPKLPTPESLLTPPIDDLAVTLPTVPSKGATPSEGTQLTKPAMRTVGGAFDPTQPQKLRQEQLDSVIVIYPPASGRFSAFGTKLVGECAIANGLGTHEPTKLFVGYSEDRTQYFLMPVGPKATKGVELTYADGLASLSLRQAFQESGKVVEDGYREYYPIWRTDEPITIHETTGWAVFFSLEQRKRERIQQREEAAETAKPKTRKRTSTAKESAETKGAAPGAESPTLATKGSTETPLTTADLEGALSQAEDEITDLLEKLKAYEEKFGKL